MKPKVALLIALAVVSAGCAKKMDSAKGKEELMALDSKWSAQATTDGNAFASFFAADGALYPSNEAAVEGPANIAAWASKMMSAPGFHVSWKVVRCEVAASGDLGFTAGTYALSMQGPNGAPVTDNGKYMTTWKKDASGAWKVAGDMFNSDLPVTGAAPADTSKTVPAK